MFAVTNANGLKALMVVASLKQYQLLKGGDNGLLRTTISERMPNMNYDEVYNLQLQLLSLYEKNVRHFGANKRQIDYYKQQLFMFAEDKVQRIFVLNQLLKIHEKTREALVKDCADRYFSRNGCDDAESSM